MTKAARAENRTPPGRRGIAPTVLSLAPWAVTAAVAAAWITTAKRRRHPPGLSQDCVDTPEHFDEREPGRGRLAAYPHRIPPTGWKDIVWRVYQEIGRDRIPVVAGGVAFYMLLSTFPAIGVFVSLYGLFADVAVVEAQLGQLAAFVPSDVLRIVGDQMIRLAGQETSVLSRAFVVSLLLSLWTASLGMRVIVEAINVAYEEVEKRHIVLRYVVTYLLTFAGLLFLVLVTAVMVAVPLALRWAGVGGLWIPLRWLLLFGIVTASFATLYRFGPSRRRARWRWVIAGAVVAAIIWIGGSLGYSWYVNNVARFQATYGSLGALVGFMVWVWFSVMALLVGAELNAEIEHQTALDSTVGEAKPMGERGAVVADSVGLAFIGFRKGARQVWGVGRRQVGALFGRRGQVPPPSAEAPPRRRLSGLQALRGSDRG